MPDKIQVNETLGIIEVESSGVVSKEDIVDSITKMRQILDEKGLYKTLVDTTLQETMPSITDVYTIFSNFPREFKIALLVQESQKTQYENSFGETVGKNRGLRVQIFLEKEQAHQWLNIKSTQDVELTNPPDKK